MILGLESLKVVLSFFPGTLQILSTYLLSALSFLAVLPSSANRFFATMTSGTKLSLLENR